MRNQRKFTVVIKRDEDGYCVGTVPTLPGCHTQAKTLYTVMKRCARSSGVVPGKRKRRQPFA
jgi:hypothetical protein